MLDCLIFSKSTQRLQCPLHHCCWSVRVSWFSSIKGWAFTNVLCAPAADVVEVDETACTFISLSSAGWQRTVPSSALWSARDHGVSFVSPPRARLACPASLPRADAKLPTGTNQIRARSVGGQSHTLMLALLYLQCAMVHTHTHAHSTGRMAGF